MGCIVVDDLGNDEIAGGTSRLFTATTMTEISHLPSGSPPASQLVGISRKNSVKGLPIYRHRQRDA